MLTRRLCQRSGNRGSVASIGSVGYLRRVGCRWPGWWCALRLYSEALALRCFLTTDLTPGGLYLLCGERHWGDLDLLGVSMMNPVRPSRLLLDDRTLRNFPLVGGPQVLAAHAAAHAPAIAVFAPGDPQMPSFAGAFGHLEGIATRVQNKGRAGIQDAFSRGWWPQARIALSRNDECAAKGTALLKEEAGFLAHAQRIEFIDDEQRLDPRTATCAEVVLEVLDKKPSQARRFVL